MTRAQLEHLIRAAADIADVDEIVVIGSQAILGQYPDDLLISKYVAGREKDRRFTGAAAAAGLASRETLLERLGNCDLRPEVRNAVEGRSSATSEGSARWKESGPDQEESAWAGGSNCPAGPGFPSP